jgi:hypothetical protein
VGAFEFAFEFAFEITSEFVAAGSVSSNVARLFSSFSLRPLRLCGPRLCLSPIFLRLSSVPSVLNLLISAATPTLAARQNPFPHTPFSFVTPPNFP